MPRTVDEPMVALRCDDERGVDGIITEIGVPVVRAGACPVLALVGHGTEHKALVNPFVRSRIAGFHHTDEGAFAPRIVEVGCGVLLTCLDVVVDDDTVVHTIEVATHTTYTWCPVAIGRTRNRRQAKGRATVVQRILDPGWNIRHRGA